MDSLANIINRYLDRHQSGADRDEEAVKLELSKLGIEADEHAAFLLKMDDEATVYELFWDQLKAAKQRKIAGYILVILGVAIALLTSFGLLLDGQISILPLGPIGGGMVLIMKANNVIRKTNKEMALRPLKWKNWGLSTS